MLRLAGKPVAKSSYGAGAMGKVGKGKIKNLFDGRATCDIAMAQYLLFLSKRVRLGFYVRALKFVFLYRDCFNRQA